MSPVSATDICILLVEPDSRCLRKMLSSLLDAGYRVVTVSRGDEALATLKRKKRKVDLVLTRTKLPDMCAFELVEILDTEFRMAVVMICDSYDGPTMLRGLMSGAMFCLSMPLHQRGIDHLWQHAAVKRRDLELELEAEMEVMLESLESSVTEEDSRNRKRKINDLEKVEGSSMALPSAITCKFLEVVYGLGVDVAAPSEVLRYMNVPGLTTEIVIEKLQQYRSYLKRQQDLNFERVSFFPEPAPNNQPYAVNQLMGLESYTSSGPSFAYEHPLMTGFLQNPQDQVNTTVFGYQADPTSGIQQMQAPPMALPDAIPPFPHVSPNTLQQLQAQVPLANTAQSSDQAPCSSTVAEISIVIALPAPGQGGDEGEKNDQVLGS